MKIKSEEGDHAVHHIIPSQAVAIHRSQQFMVPSHRRSSGCAIYNNADCSPERYRYPSPIREDHYQPRRNISPYENHRNGYHRERETVDEISYENQPTIEQQHPQTASNEHRNHLQHYPAYQVAPSHPIQHNQHHVSKQQKHNPAHQVRHSHPIQHNQHHHVSKQQTQQRFQDNQDKLHQHYQQQSSPYEEPTSGNKLSKNESVYENIHPVPRKDGRAEQPLATRVHPATSDTYAAPHCPYDYPIPMDLKCANNYNWSSGKYFRDECGSGVVTAPCGSRETREFWCKTPLSIYQSSICELGRKLLCGEIRLPPRIMRAPPCNVCEDILPPCAGYYRNYEKLPPCEEQYVKMRKGKKVYRDKVERYWEPCDLPYSGPDEDIRHYSGHNAYLAMKLNTKAAETHLDF